MYNRYYPYQYNRSEKDSKPSAPVVPKPLPPPVIPPKPPPPKPPIPAPKPPSPPPKPPKQKPPKKKFDFKCFKKDTCNSLNDVECFLNRFSNTWKYIKLIKLLK